MPPQPGAPMPEAPFDPGRLSVNQLTLSELEELFGPRFREAEGFRCFGGAASAQLFERYPTAFTVDGGPGGRAVGFLTCAPTRPPGKLRSITNPQQLLPLAKVAFETKALGDSKARNGASLDLLACCRNGRKVCAEHESSLNDALAVRGSIRAAIFRNINRALMQVVDHQSKPAPGFEPGTY